MFNVETQKWYHATVKTRKGSRLNVHLHHLNIEEWLDDTSHRLRLPRDVIQHIKRGNIGEPLLGQSDSVDTSDAVHLANTMTQGQVHLVEKGIDHEHQDQEHILKLADSISTKTDQLQKFVAKHLRSRDTSSPVQEADSTEYFIADATQTKPQSDQPTKELGDLLGENAEVSPRSSQAEEESDLGEGEDIESDDDQVTRSNLAHHDSTAMAQWQNHMDHISDVDATNKVLSMNMADLEKSARQHEILERVKVIKLAKEAGSYQHLLGEQLSKLSKEKRAQLQKVQQAARNGVWTDYQATLRQKSDQLKSNVKTLASRLRKEEIFNQKVRQHAAVLADETQRLRALEDSATRVAVRLGEVGSRDEVSLKAVDKQNASLEKSAEAGIELLTRLGEGAP